MARQMRAPQRPTHELGDVQLLALCLRSRKGLASAARLLDTFGSLDKIRRLEPVELVRHGLSQTASVGLLASLELGRRSVRQRPLGRCIVTPQQAYDWLRTQVVGLELEQLHALYLDPRHRPMAHRVLTTGSPRNTVVDPGQIFRPAVAMGACAIILAHNHPSGDPTPSAADRIVTERVLRAGRVLSIHVVDHLVLGSNSFVSLAAEGWLSAANGVGNGYR